jgi:hypothetical protein
MRNVNFRHLAAVAALVLVLPAWPAALQLDLDTRAIQEAIAIGQSRLTGERDRYHAPYRIIVASAPVDYIDVITPFRRVVLAAQAQAEIGNRTFGQRDALEALAAAPDVLEIDVELTFHPLNTYLGVPDYVVALVPPGATAPRLEPESLDRIPRYGARVSGMPLPHPKPGGLIVNKRTGPMLGGTLVAQFDTRTLMAAGRYDVVISEEGKALARGRLELGMLR